MFVKLLVLLFSNVLFSFSVLVFCRSLAQKCCLKGRIEQRTNLVLVSVLERNGAAIEREETRLSALALEPKEPAIEHTPRQPVALAPSHLCLHCGIIERLRALEHTTCDRAHPRDRQHIYFPINKTSCAIL